MAIGSPEAERLLDEVDRLVEEYVTLSEERGAATGEPLPPFPRSSEE